MIPCTAFHGTVGMIICRVCNTLKEATMMKQCRGKPCRICRVCDGKGRGQRYKKRPRSKARIKRINAKIRDKRAGIRPGLGWLICKNSRRSDKKKGRQNDLTPDFVREQISKPCSYCGTTIGRITLDRIDNSIGHMRSNVIPCCMRCNYIRRDIPYEAWMMMVPAVKEAMERGLFGEWSGSWHTTWRSYPTAGDGKRLEGARA